MTSKAAVALSRIREIDKKYKSKQEKRYSIFSESSRSIDTEKSQKLLKPQLNIKMPDAYEECINTTTSSESKKCSPSIKIIYKLPKQSTNSNDNNGIHNLEEHATISNKITTDNEDTLRKDETNESISEILEDTQSPSQISTKSTKSQKSTDGNSSQNLLSRNEISESEVKISTEEEYGENDEKSENKNSLIHYSNESFESSSSKTDNSQSTVISEQLQSVQSKTNHEKVSPKELTAFSKNESNTSNDIISDYLNVNHNKFQESEKKLNTSTKSSNSFNTYNNNNSSNEKLSNKSSSKNEKIDTKDDQTTQKQSTELEITCTYSNKQQIKSSELTSQAIFSQKCNKKKSKESKNIIEVIESSSQSSSSSISLTSSKSSKIIKLKDSKKIDTYRKSKYVHYKPNEEYRSPAMIHYIRKMREQQKLHMIPSQMICSDRIRMQSIKPLEFPNFLNVVQNNEYKNSNLNLEILQNHLSNIRQWLKEQYLIYKEKSEVAVHMNKNYHPTTLNETKKIIYQLQSKAHAKNKNQ